jgi:hypothetical protein
VLHFKKALAGLPFVGDQAEVDVGVLGDLRGHASVITVEELFGSCASGRNRRELWEVRGSEANGKAGNSGDEVRKDVKKEGTLRKAYSQSPSKSG